MFNKKQILVAASIAGLMASSSIAMAGSSFPGQDAGNKTHCEMNSCKGKASCKGGNSCAGHKNASKSQCVFKGGSSNPSAQVKDGKLTA